MPTSNIATAFGNIVLSYCPARVSASTHLWIIVSIATINYGLTSAIPKRAKAESALFSADAIIGFVHIVTENQVLGFTVASAFYYGRQLRGTYVGG